MIRFRIGQSWKREPSAAPVDAFGLDLDGVDLLAGASEESLAKVVPELVEALVALAKGAASAQISLPEAHLEVALHRRGPEVDLRVVSLARPAQLTRPPVRVELAELAQATVRCGHALVKDLTEAAPTVLEGARYKRLLRELESLERPARPRPAHEAVGWSYRLSPQALWSLGFELFDVDDLLLGFDAKQAYPLPSLLAPGACWLKLPEPLTWKVTQPPFLLALELSRAGAELVRALEASEPSFELKLSPPAPPVKLDLKARVLEVDGARTPTEPEALARGLLELGVAVCFAVIARNPAQAKNPYLLELNGRCLETLSHLRGATAAPVAAPLQSPAVKRKRRSPAEARPLSTGGKLRRLRFERLWEKAGLGAEAPGRLLLARGGPIYSSRARVCALSERGEVLYQREATHGVAASSDGYVVAATQSRATLFRDGDSSARWLRDHDGVQIGPELERIDGLLVATLASRGAIAFHEQTGRELWRVDPPRTQRGHVSLQDHRALLATDSGYLFGLDLQEGQVRFRMRAALPFAGPTVPWGKKVVGVLNQAERTAVFAADVHTGAIGWTRELTLGAPSLPLPVSRRVFIAGEVEGHGVLLCLSAKGGTLWERRLPLGRGPYRLVACGRGMIAADASGGAALVGPDSQVEWRLPPGGEELPVSVAPHLSRGVLLLPGETVRAVEPRGGRVLGEVRAGPGLCDLKVDAKLSLYLLDEGGVLKAYRLSSHFAVL